MFEELSKLLKVVDCTADWIIEPNCIEDYIIGIEEDLDTPENEFRKAWERLRELKSSGTYRKDLADDLDVYEAIEFPDGCVILVEPYYRDTDLYCATIFKSVSQAMERFIS